MFNTYLLQMKSWTLDVCKNQKCLSATKSKIRYCFFFWIPWIADSNERQSPVYVVNMQFWIFPDRCLEYCHNLPFLSYFLPLLRAFWWGSVWPCNSKFIKVMIDQSWNIWINLTKLELSTLETDALRSIRFETPIEKSLTCKSILFLFHCSFEWIEIFSW